MAAETYCTYVTQCKACYPQCLFVKQSVHAFCVGANENREVMHACMHLQQRGIRYTNRQAPAWQH